MKNLLLTLVSRINRLLPTSLKRGLYRLGPLTRWIRQALNLVSPTGITRVTVSGGALVGMGLDLDLKTEKDYWLGTYEVDLQNAILNLVRPGWVAYDVGANLGYISLLLARTVGESGQVYAFEALPDNLERLGAHIRMNDLGSRVSITSGAVTDKSGPTSFLIGPSGAMGKVDGSAGRPNIHHESIQVQGFSLDDFVYKNGNLPPQVVKMDIEGGEVLALRGMARLLQEDRPVVFLELHGPEAAKAAWDTFTSAGYDISRMETGLPRVNSLDDLDWKTYLVAAP